MKSSGWISANCWNRRCAACSSSGSSLAVLQQWCGINVIFNYAEEIFRPAATASIRCC